MPEFKINDWVKALTFVKSETRRPVLTVLDDSRPGTVRVRLTPDWILVPPLEVDLLVPIVTPVRLVKDGEPFDNGIYGSVVKLPQRWLDAFEPGERFCHPLLVSKIAGEIAGLGDRLALMEYPGAFPDFTWVSFYGRARRSMLRALNSLEGARDPKASAERWSAPGEEPFGPVPRRWDSRFAERRLQQAIYTLLQRKEQDDDPSIPLTDEALIHLHRFEVAMLMPKRVGRAPDEWIQSQLRQRFLAYLDDPANGVWCDVTFSGKNHPGERVGRIFAGQPVNHHTGLPMPPVEQMLNPFAAWANMAREGRENHSVHWLPLVAKSRVAPTITANGQTKCPAAFTERMTLANVVLADWTNRNLHIAGPEEAALIDGVQAGDKECLDIVLVTPAGMERTRAIPEEIKLVEAHEWEAHAQERGWLDRLLVEADPETGEMKPRLEEGRGQVGVLPRSQTPVFVKKVRAALARHPGEAYHKYKLMAGIKGVGDRIPPLFAIVKEKLVPVHLMISETGAARRGARSLVYEMAAGMAGMKKVDPTWSEAELATRIEKALAKRGLPKDGCFPIVRPIDPADVPEYEAVTEVYWIEEQPYALLIRALFGPARVMRAMEDERRQSRSFTGVSLNPHARNLAGMAAPREEADREQIAAWYDFWAAHHAPGETNGSRSR
jgi:hypothetical protein